MASKGNEAWEGIGVDPLNRREAKSSWRAARPSLPPLFIVAMAYWASMAAVYTALESALQELCLAVVLVGAVAVFASLLLLARCGKAVLSCLLLGIGLGVICAGCAAFSLHADRQMFVGASGDALVVMSQDAQDGSYGSSGTAVATLSDGTYATVRLNFSDGCVYPAGERLRVHASWKEPSASAASDAWRKGIAVTATVYSVERVGDGDAFAPLRAFREAAIEKIEKYATDDDSSLFLKAVLLGYRNGLYESDLYSAVRVDGLAHLVAVSGAHLVIVCGIALAIFRRFRLTRVVVLILQLGFIGAYLVLTGAPVSAVRAAIMTAIALSSFLMGRRSYPLGGLSLCIIVMLAIDPVAAFSISFVLSASSTLGIILFSRFFCDWISGVFGLSRNALVETLGLTLSALLVTSPLTASEFGQISLIAPIANVIAAPCFTLICGAGLPLVVLSVVCPSLAPLLIGAASVVCALFCEVLKIMALLPYAAVPASLDSAMAFALALLLPLALWVIWPRPSKCIAAVFFGAALGASLVVSGAASMLAVDRVIALDVGQGDAIVIASRESALLIDTGTHDSALLEGLARNGIYHLDAVLITHPDDDHCGSLAALKGVVPVDYVIVADDLITCEEKSSRKVMDTATSLVGDERIEGVRTGDRLVFGSISLTVAGPDSYTHEGGNEDSLVMVMEDDANADGVVDWTGLFCGDAEAEVLSRYITAGRIGDIDLYKVGHHGSKAAIDAETAAALRPEVSLVSVGAGNRYGHPAAATLQTLASAGSALWRTDEQGDIVCEMRPDRMSVHTLR